MSSPAPGRPGRLPDRPGERRRAWLVTALVALLVLVYLTGWSTYAALHTQDRYRQLAPGAAATRNGAEFRVLSMVRADRLTAAAQEDPETPDPGAVFVVVELEMLQQQPDPFVTCSDTDLLEAGGRVWEPVTTQVQREAPYCNSDDVVLGRPYRFENVYAVPVRDVDRVVGVAVVDVSRAARTPVLRPAA